MVVLTPNVIVLTLLSLVQLVRSNAEFIYTKADINRTLSNIFAADDELVFLTDFDGTLAEIKPNPVNTRMTAETKHLVHKLATHPNIYLAVISGRRVSDVHERVGLDNITYSGNHGLEIIFSNGTEYHYPMSPEVYKNCSLLRDEIQQKLAKNGAWLEDKNVSLTYHYGQVPDELKEKYLTQVRQLIHEYGYILVQAHLGIEIKPPVVWSKGAAAKLILQEVLGNAWTTKKIKVIFAGDDNSDEDVMRALKGNATLFRVSKNPEIETHADIVLESVKTMTDVLEWMDDNL